MPRLILLTYADRAYAAARDRLVASALSVGFDEAWSYGRADVVASGFYAANRAILDQPRGAGYWLWKPLLIRQMLDRLGPDDILFYTDTAIDGWYDFRRYPAALVGALRRSTGGYLIGPVLRQHGPLTAWTKRDAIVLAGCAGSPILANPLVQGSPNLWRATDEARALLDAWIALARDPRALTDNADTLAPAALTVRHRHDQSLLSLVAWRDGHQPLDLAATGIFDWMRLRPDSRLAHRLLKSPHYIDRLLAGDATWRVVLDALHALSRRSPSAPTASR